MCTRGARPHHVHTTLGSNTNRGARKQALGKLPMRTGSWHGVAHPYDVANACIYNICHTRPGNERPLSAETFCGKVSLAMVDRVQALPHLAFPPSMEPPLVFWYDKPQWMRPVE